MRGRQPVPSRLGRVLPVRQLADQFDKINGYARMRLAWFITSRHRRSRAFGLVVLIHGREPPGLVDLTESLPPPDPSGTGGKGRMPAVNDVGEPCAGEPHARFDGRETGNGAMNLTMVTGVAQPTGKPAEQRPQALPQESHRASPDPTPCAQQTGGDRGR